MICHEQEFLVTEAKSKITDFVINHEFWQHWFELIKSAQPAALSESAAASLASSALPLPEEYKIDENKIFF